MSARCGSLCGASDGVAPPAAAASHAPLRVGALEWHPLLRNRVFHYEPVWHRRDLAQRHQDILAAIGWVSPVVAATAAPLDRFPLVYARGSGAFRAGLEAFCRRHGYAP